MIATHPAGCPCCTDVDRTTAFSPCRRYRYTLWRELKPDLWSARRHQTCAFIGLNPSTADETTDDPTIRRCIGFATRWGFGHFVMLNAFAWRDTDPAGMLSALEPVGEENDRFIVETARAASMIVLAWGVHGAHQGRDAAVLALLRQDGIPWPRCLGRTKSGAPKHPLYLRRDSEPWEWLGEQNL